MIIKNEGDIRLWIRTANAEKDQDLREIAIGRLIDEIYESVGHNERITYNNGIIHDTYINYDSNCGLTVIQASIDIEIMADYIIQNKNIDTITINEAAEIMNEFGERDEWWDDLIDEDRYVTNEDYIIDTLKYIMEEHYDEEMRRDLSRYMEVII